MPSARITRNDIRAFSAAETTAAEPKVAYTAGALMEIYPRFVSWSLNHGAALQRESILTPATINGFVEAGLDGIADSGRSNRRAQLRQMHEVLVEGNAGRPEVMRPSDPRAPYTLDEIPMLDQWAQAQSNDTSRTDADTILALGFGGRRRDFLSSTFK